MPLYVRIIKELNSNSCVNILNVRWLPYWYCQKTYTDIPMWAIQIITDTITSPQRTVPLDNCLYKCLFAHAMYYYTLEYLLDNDIVDTFVENVKDACSHNETNNPKVRDLIEYLESKQRLNNFDISDLLSYFCFDYPFNYSDYFIHTCFDYFLDTPLFKERYCFWKLHHNELKKKILTMKRIEMLRASLLYKNFKI